MTTFDGILNNNGCEMQIRMRIQLMKQNRIQQRHTLMEKNTIV